MPCHLCSPVYAGYLVFQLWSHANLYDDKHKDNFVSTKYDATGNGPKAKLKKLSSKLHIRHRDGKGQEANALDGTTNGAANDAELENGELVEEEEEVEEPSMSVYMCIGLLIVVTVVSP